MKNDILDKIIRQIEAGCPPWKVPWACSGVSGLPTNASTKRPYSGTNVLVLWQAQEDYEHGLWLGYEQARKMGGHVRKGETATQIIAFSTYEKENDSGEKEMRRWIKPMNVFNIAQCDGIEMPVIETHQWEPLEAVEALSESSGAVIEYGGDRAFYSPSKDRIQLPKPERFACAEDFAATLIHELTHWTGHESRLNRDLKNKFGTEAYAFEELIAEIGAAMAMAHLGIRGEVTDHASYLAGWLKVLKQDARHLMTAASAASKAFEFLTSKMTEEVSCTA
jgi:antirestriction protein ArdC